ncbi:MAG: cation:proton antiporter [Leptospiraceae bacterium]|nr:cation:proton antiporter [Leptospiraceae bacterium]
MELGIMETPLLEIGLLLLAGFGSELIAERIGLPGVSLFIVTGAIIGQTGLLPPDFLDQSQGLVDLALAIIGFLIGGSLQWNRLKRLGKLVFAVLFAEFYGATVLVSLSTFLVSHLVYGMHWTSAAALAIILGSISAATAPAATMAVVHEQRARGPLTTMVLSIVAADDGLALITYAAAIGGAGMILGHEGSLLLTLLEAAREIGVSLVLGLAGSALLKLLLRNINARESMLLPTFTVILLCFGVSVHLEAGGLLSCMVLGMAMANWFRRFESIYGIISDSFESIIFTLFFLLSGMHMRLDVLGGVWILALAYFLARIVGKASGVYMAASLSRAPREIRKYAGMALVPQAGVALGLALQTHSHIDLPEGGTEILLSVVVATTTVNELLGPILTRRALILAGESHSVRQPGMQEQADEDR